MDLGVPHAKKWMGIKDRSRAGKETCDVLELPLEKKGDRGGAQRGRGANTNVKKT